MIVIAIVIDLWLKLKNDNKIKSKEEIENFSLFR